MRNAHRLRRKEHVMKTFPTTLIICGVLAGSGAAAAPLHAQEVARPSERRAVGAAVTPPTLRPVERSIERANARLERGLRARTTHQSLVEFRRAERMFDTALDRLDRVEQHATDPWVVASARALRDDARIGAVDAALDVGHM